VVEVEVDDRAAWSDEARPDQLVCERNPVHNASYYDRRMIVTRQKS
jgi:hypothetical protein